MTSEWLPTIQVTDKIVESCINSQFPQLAPLEQIKCIGAGWDNSVYLINKQVIFRFPRRKIAIGLLERENAVLHYLAGQTEIQLPLPIYIGEPCEYFPYPFQGYNVVDGQTAYECALPESFRLASLNILANFLKKLHSNHEANTTELELQGVVFDRTDSLKIGEQFLKRCEQLNDLALERVDLELAKQEIKEAQTLQLPGSRQCLIHGDLYSRHILFKQNELSGIIDWGDTAFNNRAIDLAVIWSFYPQNCQDQFLKIYTDVEEAEWLYARFLGLYSAMTTLLYAYDLNDHGLAQESRDAILRIQPNIFQN